MTVNGSLAADNGRNGIRTLISCSAGALILLALALVSLMQGEAGLTAGSVLNAILSGEQTLEHHLVWGLRMPRAVLGILAGAGLAAAGLLLQTVTRNPLASASTLGINAGAYFMVVAGTVYFPALLHEASLPIAMIGGAGAALLAFVLAGGRASTPVRMALSGMIVAMVLASFTAAIQLFHEYETQGLFLWGSGSLIQLDWSGVDHAWPWVAGGLAAAFLLARQLDVLELDDESARALGQRTGTTRLAVTGLAVLLAAAIVSVAGPIGFVGLVAPHLVRLMGIRRHAFMLAGSMIWGAAMVTGADVAARLFTSTLGELPAGAVTALIGGPWLIWLVMRRLKLGEARDSGSQAAGGFTRSRLPFAALALIFAAILVLSVLISLGFGGTRIPLGEVVSGILGRGSDAVEFAVWNFRLPRTLVAAAAGMALALSGLLMQRAVRNPLADPSVIGVTQGAAVGALALLIWFPNVDIGLLPAAAMLGAGAAATVIFVLAWRHSLHPIVLILLGIAMSAVCSAIVQVLVIQAKFGVSAALVWLSGSTYARTWDSFWQIGVVLVLGLAVVWWMGRRTDVLSFRDEIATGMGLPVRRTRLVIAALSAVLAGAAVAHVGTIGFIGLIAPHIVRMLVGNPTRKSAVLAVLLGGVLLVLADTIGRFAMAPKEIPSGLVVCLIGTPYFLLLLYRSRR